jgi:phospholipid/cholesterol/gamma-HCH transport system substrate-binding protein
MRGRLRLVAGLVASLVAVAGCGFKGAYSLPLPGGAAHGKTYHVTAIFNNVQDLTVQAAVRVNDVAVGNVTSIDVGTDRSQAGYLQAKVGMIINQGVRLPANAVATLEQTTLLGEKFVALSPPPAAAPASAPLANDAVIGNGRSSELPSVEQVFGLLSQVLNGGDLADLQTINIEISKALTGRETAVRGALTQLNTFVGGLNQQKQQIVRALDALNRFSGALRAQNNTIAVALTDLGPGLRVLADERAQFTRLLTHLATFGKVASHLIHASRTQTITGLRELHPVLAHLAAAGAALPRSLEIFITFPFPRDSGQAAPGDYTNLQADLNLTPLLCSAFAQFNQTQLLKLIQKNPILGPLIGGQPCPSSNHVGSPTTKSKSKKSGAKHNAGGGSTNPSPSPTPGSGTPQLPIPLPTPSGGLGQLLNGLLGGDSP